MKSLAALLVVLYLGGPLLTAQEEQPLPDTPDVTVAFEQGPPPAPPAHEPPHHRELGRWWKDSGIVAELQVSPEQVSRIEQAFQEHRLKLIDLRAELERQEAKLQPLIEADQPDEAKVSAQIDLVLAARNKLEKANAMMMLGIRRILTVEQWKKLEAIQQERDHRWGEHPAMAPRPARPFHPPDSPQPPTQPTPPKPGDRM